MYNISVQGRGKEELDCARRAIMCRPSFDVKSVKFVTQLHTSTCGLAEPLCSLLTFPANNYGHRP